VRIAAVSLPELRIEVVRASALAGGSHDAEAEAVREGMPLAIVVAEAPLTEAKLLGNTRIDVVSREARELGMCSGQTIAQARARASNLAVRVVRPDAVRGALARLAEIALAFGATVSFASAGPSDQDPYGDVVWVDVTGCAHLHAPRATNDPSDGEAVLAGRLVRAFGGLGHVCDVAIADGPRVAAILARAAGTSRARASSRLRGGSRSRHREEDGEAIVIVVPPGKNAVALAPLSIAALPLDAVDVRWLTKLGVRSIQELRALPRSAIATRLGSRAAVVMGLADGEDRAPLASYVPPEIPEEEIALEYGVSGSEALTFVAKTLTDRLATRLAGRAVAASRLELDLALDAALLRDGEGEGETERVQRIAIELPSPLSSASDLLAALRPKIERAVLRAPALGAKLRAASLVHKPQAALSLFEPQPKAERALPKLVAELAGDLGEEAVGRLALGDGWAPEVRSRFVRLEKSANAKRRRFLLASVPEPTRILPEPMAVPREAVKIIRHLARLEAVEWWKRLPGEGAPKGSDYVHAWVDEGPAWVEIDRATGAARVRGWFD
jgi:protein ImuB